MKILTPFISSAVKAMQSIKPFVLNSAFVIALIAIMASGCKKESEKYNLTLTANPTDAGTFTTDPELTGSIKEGTSVAVSVQPAVGYYFSQWSGDVSGDDDTLKVVMDNDKNIVAEFLTGVNETFQDDSANYFIDDNTGRWITNDTAYVMTGKGTTTWAYSVYNYNTFDNFEVSVDVTTTGNTYPGNPMGIYFRSQSQDPMANSYWAMLSSEGQWYLLKQVNGVYSFINEWTTTPDLKSGVGKTNNLKIICSGSSIEILLNGITQGTLTDATFTSGYIGLLCFDYATYTNTFIFDNFSVKPITSAVLKGATNKPVQTGIQSMLNQDPRFGSR